MGKTEVPWFLPEGFKSLTGFLNDCDGEGRGFDGMQMGDNRALFNLGNGARCKLAVPSGRYDRRKQKMQWEGNWS